MPEGYPVEVMDGAGCFTHDTIFLVPEDETCLDIPTAFTPNADGDNETWIIEGMILYPNATMRIFNRWGEMVFESKDPNLSWDGTIKGSLVQDGVYVWKMEVASERNAERKTLMGHVTVIR